MADGWEQPFVRVATERIGTCRVATARRPPDDGSAMEYNARMPKLVVEGYETVEVPADKRLVLAIEQDAGVDVMHACGGNARCTTCRVEFIEGEPAKMTTAEKERLTARGLAGVRLSCQILCDQDMAVRAVSRWRARAIPIPDPRQRRRSLRLPSGVEGSRGAKGVSDCIVKLSRIWLTDPQHGRFTTGLGLNRWRATTPVPIE